MCWLVALCVLNLVLLTTLVECDNCDMLLSDNTLKWKEDTNTSVETVTLSLEKNQTLCNSYSHCSGGTEHNTTSTSLHLYQVTIQYGQILRILLEPTKNCLNCTYKLHKVTSSELQLCDTVSTFTNTSVWMIPDLKKNSTPAYVTDLHLDKGFHFFIVEVPASITTDCELGFRLNVTVKDEMCRRNITTDICSGHGTCVTASSRASYTCQCCEGFTGQFCDSQCQGQACSLGCRRGNCLNGGTCIPDTNSQTETTDGYRCLCPESVTGPHCETNLTGCMSSPCYHGVCRENPQGYECFCVPGYHGARCELEYNECLSSPCLNRGTCLDRVDNYECRCTHGHTGRNCELKVEFCHPNPCHHNASCIDQGDTFYCVCPKGITGARCEFSIRECESKPCHNHGTCIELERGFECRCPITFAGTHCEYMMDVFAPALDRTSLNGESHVHNLYIVAGTLCGAICLMAVVLLGCYCRMHETYRQLSWGRIKYKRRSLSCPDLESYGKSATFSKSRLSVDAMLEATSLCYDNASYDTPLKNSLPVQQI